MSQAKILSRCSRIILKLSGEILAGKDKSTAFDHNILDTVASELINISAMGISIGVTIGGGNLFRGATFSTNGIGRRTADHIGMLATLMNALTVCETIENKGKTCHIMSALPIPSMVENYNPRIAARYLAKGDIVIFAGGTGNPFFSTDTAACLRAIEINADLVFKATKVDGVYNKDPNTTSEDVKFFPFLTYHQVLEMQLGIMDLPAICLCRDHNMPVFVFDFKTPTGNTLAYTIKGKNKGTLISNKETDDVK